MSYSLYVFLGLAPSFVWLLFYLRKDSRPEPKRMVLKIFLWGALAGPMAIFLQLLIRWLCQPSINWSQLLTAMASRDNFFFLNILLFAPLTEEFLKYAVVRWQVLKNPAFDEPLDAMIYLIISALGFAAVENLLNIFLLPNLTIGSALSQSLARFLSATFLHTLASGVLGYFLALSLFNLKRRHIILLSGFLFAAALHSFYNYLAWLFDKFKNFNLALAITIFLLILAGLVLRQFRLLSKKSAVCKIE